MRISKAFMTINLSIALFFLSSCSSTESKIQPEAKEIYVSSENEKYIPVLGNKYDDNSTFTVGEIVFSVTKVSIIDGYDSTKLARISYTVKNNGGIDIVPNEFWYRYVIVTQGDGNPLAIGALPLEEKNKAIKETVQQAELPLKKNKSIEVSSIYVIEDESKITLTFFDTDFNKIGSKEYELTVD